MKFCNYELNNFCKEHGILRCRTITYIPLQNGIAERINITLLNKVRHMLLSFILPKLFWDEAIKTYGYLINRSPTSALNFDAPKSIWSKNSVDYNHLKVFDCATYAHQNISKLQSRLLKCVFLSYDKNIKGYRLCVKSKKCYRGIIKRDVIFYKSIMPCLEEKKNDSIEKEKKILFKLRWRCLILREKLLNLHLNNLVSMKCYLY